MAYPTVIELARYLGIENNADSDLLTTFRASAIAYIEGPDGAQRLYEVTADSTRRFDAIRDVDGLTLMLDHDLIGVTTLTNGDGTVIDSSSYILEGLGGERNTAPYRFIRLKSSSGLTWTYTTDAENAISLVGAWGYSASAPARIAQICRELVGWLYRQRGAPNDGTGDRPMLTGDGVVILPGAVPSHLRYQLLRERTVTQ